MRYITRSENIGKEKFEVRKNAFINFGCGEIAHQEGNLQLRNQTAFITFTMNKGKRKAPFGTNDLEGLCEDHLHGPLGCWLAALKAVAQTI